MKFDWWMLLPLVWERISKPLRDAIVKSVKEWEAKAKETPNDLDDVVVAVVKWLLMIE